MNVSIIKTIKCIVCSVFIYYYYYLNVIGTDFLWKTFIPFANTAKDKIEIPSKKIVCFPEEHYCLSHSQVLQEQLLMNVLLMNESGD